MRGLWILLWLALVVVLLVPLLRRLGTAAQRPRRELADELVKDPVCQTYIARSRAVRGEAQGAPVYFCSETCARRHAASG
ncbi:MAG TPA: transcriptional regulator [Methylomirabilota bacterium]|nr:transcriptional regulator [Methylomirabilota bacterium]